MTSKAIFETATIADAVAKAARIAPTKGSAADKAAGIVIEVDPANVAEPVLVKATDLDTTIRLQVNVLELGDEPAYWRLPSNLLNGFMSTLPIGTASQVILQDTGDSYLYFKCGKTKGKMRQISGNYPLIGAFDGDGMAKAPGLAQRLNQVAWATDSKATTVLSGIHIDGEYLYGCDRACLAMVKCDVPISRPVTAPLTEVATILKNTSEVSIRAGETRLELMPDAYTQATSILFAEDYPDIKALLKKHASGDGDEIVVNTELLLSTIDRMMVLIKLERSPATNITIEPGSMRIEMDAPEIGKVIDELEVRGGPSAPFKVRFDATNLREALIASGRTEVTIRFGPTPGHPILLSDDNDFQSLLMPMQQV